MVAHVRLYPVDGIIAFVLKIITGKIAKIVRESSIASQVSTSFLSEFITTGAANKDREAKDHCAKSPCRNNGECVGLRTTFYCRCKSPYYGTNCDKKIGKREEIVDESISSEQELTAYERDLQEDNEDLRQALADQYYQQTSFIYSPLFFSLINPFLCL